MKTSLTGREKLAERLEELERTEKAIVSDTEAIRTLLLHFRKLPQARAKLMRVVVGGYRSCCETLGRAPDIELRAPVEKVLARLGIDEEGD